MEKETESLARETELTNGAPTASVPLGLSQPAGRGDAAMPPGGVSDLDEESDFTDNEDGETDEDSPQPKRKGAKGNRSSRRKERDDDFEEEIPGEACMLHRCTDCSCDCNNIRPLPLLEDIEGLPRLLEEILNQHKRTKKLLKRCEDEGATEILSCMMHAHMRALSTEAFVSCFI